MRDCYPIWVSDNPSLFILTTFQSILYNPIHTHTTIYIHTHMMINSHNAHTQNRNLIQGFITIIHLGIFNSRTNIHTPNNTSKDRMLVIQPLVGTVVIKNWDPFLFGPVFAIDTVKGRSWRRSRTNSSLNSPPQTLSPPVLSPNGLPVWIIKPLIIIWKITLS